MDGFQGRVKQWCPDHRVSNYGLCFECAIEALDLRFPEPHGEDLEQSEA